MSEDKGVNQRELATWLSSAFMLAIQDLDSCIFVLEARIQRERPYKATRLSIFLQVVGTITFQCRSSTLAAPQPDCSNTHIIGIVEVELEGAYTHDSLSGCGLGLPSTTTMIFLCWHTRCSCSEHWIWSWTTVLHPCSADKQLMDSSVKFVQEYWPPTNPLLHVLSQVHIVTTKKIEPKT